MRLITPHSQRLDRWLGPGVAESISRQTRGWYGGPIPIGNVPGCVFVNGAGEFLGPLTAGHFASMADYATDRTARAVRRWARRQQATCHMAGFASLSDLINEVTVNEKRQDFNFQKFGTTAVTGVSSSLFNVSGTPEAGGVGGTSGTGRVCSNSTTGALAQTDPAGGDTQHLINASVIATQPGQVFALYDRLWDMTYNHASSTSTAIDSANRPTRYQGSTTSIGNFIGAEITTTIAATSHTVTITYVDQAGNTPEAATAQTMNLSTAVNVFWPTSVTSGGWFWPINSGDRGVRYLTNIAQSTITSVTGVQTWWIGHMLGILPISVSNFPTQLDGINTAFNLARIYDGACISFFEMVRRNTTATTYSGLIMTAAG